MAYFDDDDPVWDLYEVPQLIRPPPDNNQLVVSVPKKSDEDLNSEALTDPSSKVDVDEDSRIKALVNTPALDWQKPYSSLDFAFGRGMRGGRMVGGRGFCRGGGLPWKKPPAGYVCHRCNVAGHFIQHCPTNGDPNYDFKKMKPPTGIPKSMLIPNSDGVYTLPTGDVAVLKPDEAAFEKETEGMPSTRRLVGDVPKELYCVLCKQIMKFAVLSSKCCFRSFCDECIRKFMILKSMCVCGATDTLADDLLPNLTLRKTINRIMESNDGSGVENDVSALRVQDMGSTNLQAQVPSPVQSVSVDASEDITCVSAGVKKPEPKESVVRADKQDAAEEEIAGNDGLTNEEESIGIKEPAPQGRSVHLADEQSEAAKKKKSKKIHMPLDAAEMQWNAAQNISTGNYMMPMAFAAYNPYWTTAMQPRIEGFWTPYAGAFPYVGFGVSASGMPFGGMLPQDHCAGAPSVNRIREEFEADRMESLECQELDSQVSSSRDISWRKSKTIIPSRSASSHHSKRPFTDCREHDYYNYKRLQRHGDEHYHYQDDRHHHHHRDHHRHSRHRLSVE